MEAYGTVTVYAFTSDARLPVEGAVVTLSASGQEQILQKAKTDRSGSVPAVTVATPAPAESRAPNGVTPFASVTVTVTHPDYETERISGIQIFPDTLTVQGVRMIPSNPLYPGQEIELDTPVQDL